MRVGHIDKDLAAAWIELKAFRVGFERDVPNLAARQWIYYGQRTAAVSYENYLEILHRSSWRPDPFSKPRHWRAFRDRNGNILQSPHWLAARQCESHRSPLDFPANREFNRENRYFGAADRDLFAESRSAAATSRAIPYAR